MPIPTSLRKQRSTESPAILVNYNLMEIRAVYEHALAQWLGMMGQIDRLQGCTPHEHSVSYLFQGHRQDDYFQGGTSRKDSIP